MAHTGLEISNTSQLFVYDNTCGERSLFVIHDADDNSGGEAGFDFTGLPNNSYFSVYDDPPPPTGSYDSYDMTPPDAWAEWVWQPIRTDGAVIGGMSCDFEITVSPEFRQGINNWILRSGDVDSPEEIDIPSMTEPVTITCSSAGADDDEDGDDAWDHHKMHFPQLPDEDGWDVSSGYTGQMQCLADDWMCSESGYVTDIHFWGSWHAGLTGNITGL